MQTFLGIFSLHNINCKSDFPTLCSFLSSYGMIFIVPNLKFSTMVIYHVILTHDAFSESSTSVSKSSRSRVNKDRSHTIPFSVLCRNRVDALRCIEFHLSRFFRKNNDFIHYSDEYDINDWSVTLSRVKVDSRNINFTYIMMDGMSEPLMVGDMVHDNLLRLGQIFRT